MLRIKGLLSKSLFACSETFFDKSKACFRRCQNSPFGLKQLTSLVLRFAKIYEQKNVSTNRSKALLFGQQPVES
jgi:hypothetical protein